MVGFWEGHPEAETKVWKGFPKDTVEVGVEAKRGGQENVAGVEARVLKGCIRDMPGTIKTGKDRETVGVQMMNKVALQIVIALTEISHRGKNVSKKIMLIHLIVMK